jgi:hypothetical protein
VKDAGFEIVSALKIRSEYHSTWCVIRLIIDLQNGRVIGWPRFLYPVVDRTIARNAREILPSCAKEPTMLALVRTASLHRMLL